MNPGGKASIKKNDGLTNDFVRSNQLLLADRR